MTVLALNNQKLVDTENIRGLKLDKENSQIVIHLKNHEFRTMKVRYISATVMSDVFEQIQQQKLKRG